MKNMIVLLMAMVLLAAVSSFKSDTLLKKHAFDIAERFSAAEPVEAGDVVVLAETKIDERIASSVLDVEEDELKEAMKELNVDDVEKLPEIVENDDALGRNETISTNAITGNVVNEITNTNEKKIDAVEAIKQKLIEEDDEIKTTKGKDKLIAAKAAVVKLTNVQNDPNIIGVVSSKPAFIMGFGSELKDAASVPVALVGRVPVKISLENGAISKGDPLTTSSKKGYAAKAVKSGRIIGYAMEDYNANSKIDKILVYLQPGWWQAPIEVQQPVLQPSQQLDYITKVNGTVIIRIG